MQKILIIFLLFGIKNLIAQRSLKLLTFKENKVIEKITAGGTIQFKPNLNLTAKQLLAEPTRYMGLDRNFAFKEKNKEQIINALSHERYKQYYKGIEVEEGEIIIHLKNGIVSEATSQLIEIEEDTRTTAAISKEKAIEIALAEHNATEYYWQNAYRKSRAKAKGKSYLPNPELCLLPQQDGPLLCYKMYVYSTRPQKTYQYFVNAITGTIERAINMEIQCFGHKPEQYKAKLASVPQYLKKPDNKTENFSIINCFNMTVTTPYDGVQLVSGQYDSDYAVPYLPINACNNAVNTVMTTDGYIYKFGSNNWDLPSNSFSSLIAKGVGLISFGMQKTDAFFSTNFGRAGHGPNNNGVDIDVHFPHLFTNNAGDLYPFNASYLYDPVGNDDIYVGEGAGTMIQDIFASPDIIGHEYQHGVDAYRASLTYEGESGALDESYADIFGEAVERYIRGTTDYKIGNEVRFGGLMRNLNTPNTPGNNLYNLAGASQPDRYNGFYWKNTANTDDDRGGVHTNSGVQNRMFYLLVNGGAGFTNNGTSQGVPYNNIGYSYTVNGLGWDKAINIAYHSQNYLTSGSTFAQARQAWVQAAVALYGNCSNEAIQTGLAWHAVGLQPPGSNYEQVCTTVLLANSIPYILGSSPITLGSSTYMDVAGLNICNADVNASGQLLQLVSNSDVLLEPGFNAPEGSNVLVNNNFNACIFASY